MKVNDLLLGCLKKTLLEGWRVAFRRLFFPLPAGFTFTHRVRSAHHATTQFFLDDQCHLCQWFNTQYRNAMSSCSDIRLVDLDNI